jgi:hypothetical protein
MSQESSCWGGDDEAQEEGEEEEPVPECEKDDDTAMVCDICKRTSQEDTRSWQRAQKCHQVGDGVCLVDLLPIPACVRRIEILVCPRS